jgi:hypothetical protein
VPRVRRSRRERLREISIVADAAVDAAVVVLVVVVVVVVVIVAIIPPWRACVAPPVRLRRRRAVGHVSFVIDQ